jgi:hypothetical protein
VVDGGWCVVWVWVILSLEEGPDRAGRVLFILSTLVSPPDVINQLKHPPFNPLS